MVYVSANRKIREIVGFLKYDCTIDNKVADSEITFKS